MISKLSQSQYLSSERCFSLSRSLKARIWRASRIWTVLYTSLAASMQALHQLVCPSIKARETRLTVYLTGAEHGWSSPVALLKHLGFRKPLAEQLGCEPSKTPGVGRLGPVGRFEYLERSSGQTNEGWGTHNDSGSSNSLFWWNEVVQVDKAVALQPQVLLQLLGILCSDKE